MASVSISCPSCSATDGVVRNGKSTAGHQRYLCSHCRKTWQLQFTYTASQPPDISAISALTAVKHGNCSSLTPLLNSVRTRKSLI
ncbi:hypothetical protein O5190_00485 [Escherichia coli]|nr:hypothetical protein [Escherichia coli]